MPPHSSPATVFRNISALACLLVLGASSDVRADEENLLSYSEDTEIVPTGRTEIYNWLTLRQGKASGSYSVTDYFAELEYGLTARSQISLYLTAADYRIRSVPDLDDRRSTAFTGVRLAYKHLLRDHERDGYGLAVYLEPELGLREGKSGASSREYALETKIIYQKESRDERWVYLANLALEPELAREEGVSIRELKVEASHGISHQIARRWYAGLENRWVGVYPGWQIHRLETNAWFLGPTLHYQRGGWWFTLTWMRQLQGSPSVSHGLAFEDFTRQEWRLKFGVEF